VYHLHGGRKAPVVQKKSNCIGKVTMEVHNLNYLFKL